MAISSEFLVQLSGRTYPTYPGVLGEAHERGLQSIVTRIVQIPDESNGHTAIVEATVTLAGGQVFTDYGDASPRNVNPRIATALLRMASTRAKGRALRDAINCGQTLLEELPDLEGEPAPESRGDRAAGQSVGDREEKPAVTSGGPAACEECGVLLTAGQAGVSRARYQALLCPQHQRGREPGRAA